MRYGVTPWLESRTQVAQAVDELLRRVGVAEAARAEVAPALADLLDDLPKQRRLAGVGVRHPEVDVRAPQAAPADVEAHRRSVEQAEAHLAPVLREASQHHRGRLRRGIVLRRDPGCVRRDGRAADEATAQRDESLFQGLQLDACARARGARGGAASGVAR
jgi:hypothetical protein